MEAILNGTKLTGRAAEVFVKIGIAKEVKPTEQTEAEEVKPTEPTVADVLPKKKRGPKTKNTTV